MRSSPKHYYQDSKLKGEEMLKFCGKCCLGLFYAFSSTLIWARATGLVRETLLFLYALPLKPNSIGVIYASPSKNFSSFLSERSILSPEHPRTNFTALKVNLNFFYDPKLGVLALSTDQTRHNTVIFFSSHLSFGNKNGFSYYFLSKSKKL